MKTDTLPLLIEFAPETSLYREADLRSQLPIVRNGPPGTFVVFPDGLLVSLPTDQIVCAEDVGGRARVGFGGMRFAGLQDGRLIFLRVRELWPEEQLSDARSHTMILERRWVAAIFADGDSVWPPTLSESV
jgi:hypothetical protein